jgi:hypothetical protein
MLEETMVEIIIWKEMNDCKLDCGKRNLQLWAEGRHALRRPSRFDLGYPTVNDKIWEVGIFTE